MPQLPIVGIVPMFWGLDLNSNVDQRLRLPFVGAVWKQATQLEHGLFPPNAALLPRYIGWSQPQMDSVLLLFQGVANLSDDKLGQVFSARARSDLSPAKALWKRAWQCIWKRLDGMNTVTCLMVRNNCHPHQIMERESRITYPSKPPSLGNLHQDIANELFGPELSTIDLGDGEMVISSDVMAIIDRMISIVWHSLSVKTSRMQMESGALHEDILQRFTGVWTLSLGADHENNGFCRDSRRPGEWSLGEVGYAKDPWIYSCLFLMEGEGQVVPHSSAQRGSTDDGGIYGNPAPSHGGGRSGE